MDRKKLRSQSPNTYDLIKMGEVEVRHELFIFGSRRGYIIIQASEIGPSYLLLLVLGISVLLYYY